MATDNPYPPPPDHERRISSLEGWRGTVDEWRQGVDAWRRVIDREGLVTAVAVIGTKMDQARQDRSDDRALLNEVKEKVEKLEDDRNIRKGVVVTGRSAAAFVAALAGAAAIIALLVQGLTS